MLLLDAIRKERDFAPLLSALKKENKPVLVTGVTTALRPAFCCAVLEDAGGKALFLLPDEKSAAAWTKDLASLFPRTLFFPARDWALVGVDSAGKEFSAWRLRTLAALQSGDFDCVVTTPEAALQATLPPEVFEKMTRRIAVGDALSKEEILRLLLEAGYRETERVEGVGQFASRGDLVDLFPAGSEEPYRIELFGDEVDAIGRFDLETQRRIENVPFVTVTPAEEIAFSREDLGVLREYLSEALKKSGNDPREKERRVFLRENLARLEADAEIPRDLFLPLVYRFATLLDYWGEETVFFFGQSDAEENLKTAHTLLQQQLTSLTLEQRCVLDGEKMRLTEDFVGLCRRLGDQRCLLMENFFAGKSPIPPHGIFQFRTRTQGVDFRTLEGLAQSVASLREEGYRTLFLCENSLAVQTASQYFREKGKRVYVADGSEKEWPEADLILLSRVFGGGEIIREGFSLADSRIAVLCDAKAEKAAFRKKKRRQGASAGQKILSYTELAVGDYVVHAAHGIGIFRGVEKMRSAEGVLKDFIKISYAGSDVLYVPCSGLDAVTKYIGPKSDSAALKLHKLGGQEWQKAKSAAKKSAADIAKRLIALYAERSRQKGFAFSPDTTWQGEFEEAFPYGETEGQLQATREIKADMEKPCPMDRLLCGDVGFGKTEVALRGVFKCVMDNKQAAILVPTTILAWQHYQTVLARFRGYPVRVEMLSRFRSKKEQKEILRRLSEGQIDILVGTHRLLQEDVVFSDLGFLVIDEEQRFGVTHKERLKEISRNVDVLSLSATPIPRTLNMALGGIKDMSLLQEAPEDRLPVQTYVMEHDRGLIEEAIRRELRRNGQVFYLHNNIRELEERLPYLQRVFPEAGIAVAHGKMDKDTLSDVWKDMMDHQVDILLCTTIIETGVDLPDANTLIVENADHFGLSQLHQIRGRVGRSDRKAYAYFTYRRGKQLSEISVKRLEAIREYTRFGSGFQIALRDLEIRGAGNLLGAEQSGHLDSVGYEMFMKILSDAVLEEKGEKKPEAACECTVDLALDGYIPEAYVPYPADRMDLYRKIASIRCEEDKEELLDEMLDRFGEVPRCVLNLFGISLLRGEAEALFCEKIAQRGKKIRFTFCRDHKDAFLLLSAVYASRLDFSFGGKTELVLTLEEKKSPLVQCTDFLCHLKGFCRQNS